MTSDRQTPPSGRDRIHGFTASALAVSLIAPFITSFIVMNSLVGIADLKRHWWLVDGLILTLAFNAVFMSRLLSRKSRAVARFYIPCIAALVAVISYLAFEYWMVAVMGV